MINPIKHGGLMYWRWRHREYWWLRKSHKFMPLTMYAGLPGSGKTLFAVQDAVQLLRAGENVYSNLYIRDRVTGAASRPCHTWLDMVRLAVEALERDESAYFVWDEIHLHCDSRSWSLTPEFLLHVFAQRRHYRIGLIATTQHVDQVEKRLRTLVDRIVNVRPTGLREAARALFRRELPLFWQETLNGALVDVPGADPVLGKGLAVTKWYSWSSYSTHEVVAGEDLAAYKDDEVREFIADLTTRAQLCCQAPHIESYHDRLNPSLHADFPLSSMHSTKVDAVSSAGIDDGVLPDTQFDVGECEDCGCVLVAPGATGGEQRSGA